ncbi:hypothetical protein Ciccas_001652 [Cichlidogyrus casuarinus]|uniref:Autophagy-related protein 101 n=1 Tax=Cichlidogyrus casuarinus TaxID=1844966 RepID=A0ABD2QJD9_9PLAT
MLDFRGGSVCYDSNIGTKDVDCKTLDLTYVCTASDHMNEKVDTVVAQFADILRNENVLNTPKNQPVKGSILLEFNASRKSGWPLVGDACAWERWIVTVQLLPHGCPLQEKDKVDISDKVRAELMEVLQLINSNMDHVPSLGCTQIQSENVIDFSFSGICPYKFSLQFVTGNGQNKSAVGLAMRRLLKEGRF